MSTLWVNYWADSACAKAFWRQQDLPPYRKLLADTVAWLEPRAGERWLDLGCGCGQLTRALWLQSAGALAEIVGLDCAAVNERAYRKLRANLYPPPLDRIHFIGADFSAGLPRWEDNYFDGVVSGLAIPYAESYSEASGQWTTEAYDRVVAEVARVLRPGGRFVFSTNVPDPCWLWVAVKSLAGFFQRNPFRFLKTAGRIWSYGNWLKRESRRGRFHYLPVKAVADKLGQVGLVAIEHRLSFAGQAYVFRCRKPLNTASGPETPPVREEITKARSRSAGELESRRGGDSRPFPSRRSGGVDGLRDRGDTAPRPCESS